MSELKDQRFELPSTTADVPISPVTIGDGPLLFVSGQVGVTRGSEASPIPFETEVENAMEKIHDILKSAGSGLEQVCRVGVYLSDSVLFAPMNDVYRRWFAPPFPARTTVQAGIIRDGARIEIDVVARLVSDSQGPTGVDDSPSTSANSSNRRRTIA